MNTTIEHNMAMEYITTLYRVSNPDHFEAYQIRNKYTADEEVSRLFSQLISDSSSMVLKDVELLFKDLRVNFYYIMMLIGDHDIHSVEQLIELIKSFSAEAYRDTCFQITFPNQSLSTTDKELRTLLEAKYNPTESKILYEFIKEPKLYKERLDQTLESFYTSYFIRYEEKISNRARAHFINHKEEFDQSPYRFLNILGNGDYKKPIDSDHPFKIYMCYLEEYCPRYLTYNNTSIFVYGFGEIQKLERPNLDVSSKEILKTLAVETRLEILRLLSQKDWNRSDLVRQMKLTSATMTYQLNILIELGIVRVGASQSGKRSVYTLDKDRLRELMSYVTEDILTGGKS